MKILKYPSIASSTLFVCVMAPLWKIWCLRKLQLCLSVRCEMQCRYILFDEEKKQLNPVWAAFFWKLVLDMIDFNLIWYGHVKYCRYPKKVFWSTRSYAGPRLHCLAKIQFGRVHFGVFSTSCFVSHGSQLRLDLTCFVIRHPSSIVHHPPSVIRHLSSAVRHPHYVIHHLSSVACHLSSIIRHSSSVIHRPSSAICHRSSVIGHPSSVLVCIFSSLFPYFFPFFPYFLQN